MANEVLPKTQESSTPPQTLSTKSSTKESSINKGESKILEPKYDKKQICNYSQCPITKKQILFGMHCVFFENKTYHASCAKQIPIMFKIQQPAKRPTEASFS